MSLRSKLKELRLAREFTQQELAVAAGLSVTALVQLEQGRITDPRISTVRMLARALGVSLDELAGEGEEEILRTPPRRRGPRRDVEVEEGPKRERPAPEEPKKGKKGGAK